MSSGHGKQEISDPLEEMLKKTGCIDHHYKVQECIVETQDWRKCQNQVAEFRKCMSENLFGLVQETKMVIIIRTDLHMSKGKIASQAAHAAVGLYESAVKSSSPCLNKWVASGQPKVILRADSYDDLIDVYEKARGLNTCAVYDAGRTQIEAGTLTAVGVGPNEVGEVDKITGRLKLL